MCFFHLRDEGVDFSKRFLFVMLVGSDFQKMLQQD